MGNLLEALDEPDEAYMDDQRPQRISEENQDVLADIYRANGVRGYRPVVENMYFQNIYPYGYQRVIRPAEIGQAKCIQNRFNLNKDSLQMSPYTAAQPRSYLQFEFDALRPCLISFHFMTKEITNEKNQTLCFTSDDPHIKQFEFKAGPNQSFPKQLIYLDLSTCDIDDMKYITSDCIPLVICIEDALRPERSFHYKNTQMTFVIFEEVNEEIVPKIVKQKVQIRGRCFETKEIYGTIKPGEAEHLNESKSTIPDPLGKECVVCMFEAADTAVMPCRHMCLCFQCASLLRNQSNKCPICRATVESLLQIKFKKKRRSAANEENEGDIVTNMDTNNIHTTTANMDENDNNTSQALQSLTLPQELQNQVTTTNNNVEDAKEETIENDQNNAINDENDTKDPENTYTPWLSGDDDDDRDQAIAITSGKQET